MDVTPLIRSDQQVIQSYAGGRFKVSGAGFEISIIVFPDFTLEWGVDGPVSKLHERDFEPLTNRARELDVVLLGCGAHMEFMPPFLRQKLKDKGLSVEIMDTGAACRTYNVLMADGRRVAAALLPF